MAANRDTGFVGNQQWPAFNLQGTSGLLITNSTAVGAIDYSICDAIWDKVALVNLANATANAGANESTASSSSGATGSSATASGSTSKPISGAQTMEPSGWKVWIGMALLIGGLVRL